MAKPYFTLGEHFTNPQGFISLKRSRLCLVDKSGFFRELVGQNCNSIKNRILCLRFINITIIPLNTVLANRFLKSFYKIIETLS